MHRTVGLRCGSGKIGVAVTAALLFAAAVLAAEKARDEKQDAPPPEAAIRATAEVFAKAFNRGDATAVAALFTDNATLSDDRGRIFKGRKAIEAEYAALLKAHPRAKIEVAIASIEFPSPTTAIEDGTARIFDTRDGPPTASRYTAVHVQVDGKWRMASVREQSVAIPSTYAALRDFEWLIGTWEAKGDGATVKSTVRWLANKSFLERQYTVRRGDRVESSGVQIIGWDGQSGQVRSWTFDSSGGHGTGLWTPTADGWRIDSRGMLADGTPTASQEHLVRVAGENNVLGWRSTNRSIADQRLPDLREVVLERVTEKR